MSKIKVLSFTAVISIQAAIVVFFGVKYFMGSLESDNVIKIQTKNFIISKEFSEADKKLADVKRNLTRLEIIIEDILKKINQSEFEILLEYAKKTEIPEVSYLILKNFWIGLNSESDIDLTRLMDIYKTCQSKVIKDKNIENELKSLISEICENRIRSKLLDESVAALKTIFLEKPDFDFEAADILDPLFNTSEEIFDDVNKLAIDGLFEMITRNELLLKFTSPNYLFPKNVFTILHLMSTSKTIFNIIHGDFWIPFGVIKDKLAYERKHKLSTFTENKYQRLLDYFPTDVKTLLLSKNVCFRNFASRNYLCRSSYQQDDNIELCISKTSDTLWQIFYALYNIFHILEPNNNKRHMYIPETNKMTVRVGNSSEYGNWGFYKTGNSFSIFSFDSGNFLCSSDINRGAVTLMKKGDYNTCRWLVESC